MQTKENKNQKGITLIALVVTIVVLLILAGISINIMVGEDGIIGKASKAKNKTSEALQNELSGLNSLEDILNDYSDEKPEKYDVNTTKTEGSDLFSTTVTIDVDFEVKEFDYEQKKKIAAALCDYSTYEELKNGFGINEENLNKANMTEEQAVDKIIEIGRRFIDYSNTSKLRNLGVKIASVKTPYGSTLYTSNLGEPVKCSFNKNGTYDFIIKSGATEVKKTVTIDNIRTASTTAPYKVNIMTSGVELLYSTDETNDWKTLDENTVIECNNAINIKYAGAKPTGTIGKGLHYVEKNNEYYKYFNDEQPMEWGAIRSSYALGRYIGVNNNQKTIRQLMVAGALKLTGGTFLQTIAQGLYTSRTINFVTDFPNDLDYKLVGKNTKFTDEMSRKYSELELGHDNVITWTASGDSTSPVYKLEVDHDMSVIMYGEGWD